MDKYCNNCGSHNIVVIQDMSETEPVVKIKCNDCHCEYNQLISSFYDQTAPPYDLTKNHKITLDDCEMGETSINTDNHSFNLNDFSMCSVVQKIAVQIIDEKEKFIIDQIICDIRKNLNKYGIDELYYISREDIKKILLLGLEKLKGDAYESK